MRGSNALAVSSQTTLIGGRKNAVGHAYLVSKLKNSMNSIKQAAKNLEVPTHSLEQENKVSCEKKTSHILPNSKKIQKLNTTTSNEASRKAFEDLTNYYKTKVPVQTSYRTFKAETKIFVEDGVRKTSNYVALNYLNKNTRKSLKFYCFQESELGVKPTDSQTIEHNCDNDCTTDEDQVKVAVRSLQKALEAHVQKLKQEEEEQKGTE